MDFTITADQKALVALATQVLGERTTQARLSALDAEGTWFDTELWAQLAATGVVGAALRDDVGGLGLGFTELALLLEQVGGHVAQVPLLEAVAFAALPLDQWGSDLQRHRDLPDVAAGRALLAAALSETGRASLLTPRTSITVDGESVRVSGTKSGVALADRARRLVVSGVDSAGAPVLALVEPTTAGVSLAPGVTTHGLPSFEVTFDGATGEVLAGGDNGADALAWVVDRVLTAVAATALGVSGTALRLAARYTTTREQFGRPIATFQAVGHRLADSYIDVEAMRLTLLQAVWLLDAGLPARDEVRVATWWAAEGGHRVAHAAQHVHGGIGIDLDYELHRYFRWAKYLEFTVGGAQAQLLSLGAALAARPA